VGDDAGHRKTLDLVWKEPVTLPGDGQLLVVKNQIAVKLEETTSLIVANMQLKTCAGRPGNGSCSSPLMRTSRSRYRPAWATN